MFETTRQVQPVTESWSVEAWLIGGDIIRHDYSINELPTKEYLIQSAKDIDKHSLSCIFYTCAYGEEVLGERIGKLFDAVLKKASDQDYGIPYVFIGSDGLHLFGDADNGKLELKFVKKKWGKTGPSPRAVFELSEQLYRGPKLETEKDHGFLQEMWSQYESVVKFGIKYSSPFEEKALPSSITPISIPSSMPVAPLSYEEIDEFDVSSLVMASHIFECEYTGVAAYSSYCVVLFGFSVFMVYFKVDESVSCFLFLI